MSDDAKEWVTVKVPEAVRDDARKQTPTYGDLILYGIEAYKADLVGSNAEGDIWVDGDVPTEDPDEVLTGAVLEQLDRIESAAKEATNAAESTKRVVEELEGRR